MKRTVLVIFTLAMVLLAVAPSTLASPVPAPLAQTWYHVTINGGVTDNSILHHPLPDSIVTVAIAPYDDPDGKWQTFTAETDEFGHYSIELNHYEPGPYRAYIKATHTGYWAMASRPVTKWYADGTYSFGSHLMPGASGNVYEKWVGLRNSYYGVTDPNSDQIIDYGYPSEEEWGDAVNEMKDYAPASYPTLLLIVGEVNTENSTNGGINFWFPQPTGVPDNSYITYEEKDDLDIENLLDYCDDNDIAVFLQVESGHADVVKLIDIVMDHVAMDDDTGNLHRSVVGFGVDLEWYKDSDETCNSAATCGQQISNTAAEVYERLVKRYSPDLQLLLKHFARIDYPAWNKFPPDFRGDIIFVNDSNELASLGACVDEMEMFADYYAPNDVIFQQGYEIDRGWWENLSDPIPGTYGKALFEVGNNAQAIGFLWVDFTMRDVLGAFGEVPYTWVGGASYDVGDLVNYDGSTWECTYAHTAQGNWYPGAPGLWFWDEQSSGIEDWRTGRYYAPGSMVTYGGNTWECTYAHTSQVDWYPGAPGLWFWQIQ